MLYPRTVYPDVNRLWLLAAGYVGWLPALDFMPPLTEQRVTQTVGPVIHHLLFGVATVAVYRWLKKFV